MGFIVLLGLCSLGAIALAEVILRIYFRHFAKDYFWYPNTERVYPLDPRIGGGLPTVARTRINSRGERGSEPPRNRKSVYNALVIGGSGAECGFLNLEDSFPFRVQAKLEAAIQDGRLAASAAHVGNLSKSEIDCEALSRVAQMMLPRHEPYQCIVLYVGFSDVIRWVSLGMPGESQYTPIDETKLLEVSRSVTYHWSVRRCAIAELRRRGRRLWIVKEPVGKLVVNRREQRARQAIQVTGPVESLDVPLRRFERHFRRLLRICREHSERVVVVPQVWLDQDPDRIDIQPRLWFGGFKAPSGKLEFVSRETIAGMLRRFHDVTVDIARDANVEVLDVVDRYPWGPDELYDDAHFNARGADLMGGFIAEALLGKPEGTRDQSTPVGISEICVSR